MKNLSIVWGEILKYLEKNYPTDYQKWFILLEFDHFDKKNNLLRLKVSNPFVRETILSQYKKIIEEVFCMFTELKEVNIEIVISQENNIFDTNNTNLTSSQKEKQTSRTKNIAPIQSDKNTSTNIYSRFTFERFVVGSNNRLAYSVALHVVQNVSKEYSYNPFFIYGGVGLGKTHLMQAIGNYILKHRPELKVVYSTLENYLNDYVISIQKDKGVSFRNKYRSADFLLLDDIQFLENKDSTQEELFNNFNILYQNNKQIVITSDKPPKELKKIQERLIDRFGCGIVMDIKPPDLETRIEIIKRKMEENNILSDFPVELIVFLAEKITTNIRDLEAAVSKIKSLIQLGGFHITQSLLEEQLSDIFTLNQAKKRNLTCEIIQKEVASFYKIGISDLKSSKRNKEISYARQMAIFLIKELLNLSFVEIGNQFGNRDHSTIINAYRQIKSKIDENQSIRNEYETLIKILSQY